MQAVPLSDRHLDEIRQTVGRALQQWLTDEALTEPLGIVRALDRVLLFLKQNGDASAQARQVSSLAFALGEQLTRTGDWQWKSVSEDGSVNPAVVSSGRACLVIDAVTSMVMGTTSLGLVELFRGLVDRAQLDAAFVVEVKANSGDALGRLERDVLARLLHVRQSLRMWGSPEELEAVAEHFTHVLLAARTPGWTFEETHTFWTNHGAPFAADAEEHALMRSRLWAEHVDVARTQVRMGYLSIWTALARDPERERCLLPWIERLLDEPSRAGTPDRLNAVLFALIGFVARDPHQYLEQLGQQRSLIGGHALRPFHVVAPPGPSEVHLPYTRAFDSWAKVAEGIASIVAALESKKS